MEREPIAAGPRGHPEELLRVDREYIVSWGRREVAVVIILAAGITAALLALAVRSSAWWAAPVPLAVGLAAFLVAFFRNPRRDPPRAPGLLVSPADGTVVDIERVDEPEFLGGPSVRIGIFLSLFDVHVNRSPARGRVEWLRYRKGAFHDARREEARRENESNAIGLAREDDGGPDGVRLLVRQISGAIARRIICPLEDGAQVERGGLLGMIKYGSRTELFIPESAGADLRVAVGDKVKGGTSVIAAWAAVGSGERAPAFQGRGDAR